MPARKKKTPADAEAIFYAALFAAIARHGWTGLTLPAIARATKTPLARLLVAYPDRYTLLTGFAAFIDRRLAASDLAQDGPVKDRLFEVVMQRLDALAPYRAGLIRLMDDMRAHPLDALALAAESFTAARRSATLMLELAGISRAYGVFIFLRAGLECLYLHTLRSWKHDTSPDLAATMATLDRALERLLRAARLL